MDAIQQAYVAESREMLQMMEDNLLQMEENSANSDTINSIFRAAHTIKGGAGIIECNFIVEFTHVLENVLDEMHSGTITSSPALIEVLLSCSDQLGTLLACVENKTEPSDEINKVSLILREKLQHYLDKLSSADKDAALSASTVHASNSGLMESDNWHLSLRFGPNVMRKGMDPATSLRFLTELGQIVHLITLPDAIPEAAEMDAESCYLGFEISFRSNADKARIENVFNFVREDCLIHIWPPHSKLDDFINSIETLPEDSMRLGEILVKCGALTMQELEQALTAQADQKQEEDQSSQTKIGDVLVTQGAVTPELVDAAAAKQDKIAEKKSHDSQLIRVPAAKLDQLIDLVGEMVIACAGANMLARKSGEIALVESTSVITMLVEQIRDSALQLRMVQIGETFTRFQRVVHDISRELGKNIELVISGSEAELDKSVVEKLGDPLMHLVRNALDHGIETPQVRIAKGKPAKGTLKLNAYHESGSIAIEIIDDGAGMNREGIINKAHEKEIIGPNQTLTDNEILGLIFEPGFSTADKATNLSGRGVGLDVVKRNITALRGSIEVDSKENEGSTFRIRLPLTLAIIDGFLVGVGKSSYVIPLVTVEECIELSEKDHAETCNRQYINLRGEVLPFVRLREQFEVVEPAGRRENIVVVQYAGQKIGLVVDELLGEFQTVIKPLGSIFKHIKGIGGSTILGSGDVALILDVQSLVALTTAQQNRGHTAETMRV